MPENSGAPETAIAEQGLTKDESIRLNGARRLHVMI
jgi:hypothetical protein